MAYHEDTYSPRHNTHNQPRRRKHISRCSPDIDSHRNRSRYTEPARQATSPPPQRRRWATGYIDRRDCPSYAYIDTRPHSADSGDLSDAEYIVRPEYRTEGYIQPHQPHHARSYMSTNPKPRSQQDRHHHSYEPEHSTHDSSSGEEKILSASDVESLNTPSLTHRRRRRRRRSPPADPSNMDPSNIDKRQDVSPPRRPAGSDIDGAPSRRASDTQSLASLSAASDIELQKRGGRSRGRSGRRSAGARRKETESDSDSDSDGGYISLDDYITRSGYASEREGSGDEGEGSDGVGSSNSDSDVESDKDEGSDALMGSDVESLEDGGCDSGEEWIGEGGGGGGSRARR